MITRRTFLQYTGATTLTLFAIGRGGLRRAIAAALPGGSLDPATIPKFVAPLLIPPVMPRAGTIKLQAGKNADYYEISVQQIAQQILPAGMPATTVWGYGSVNGAGSRNALLLHHAPSLTIEADWKRPVRVKWINGLVDPNGRFLPHLLPVDPTLHWANPPGGDAGRDTRPTFASTPGRYTGPVPIVTHVHGADGVGDESDGYAEAWYLAAASNVPAGYAHQGTWYDFFAGKAATKFGETWGPGFATFQYPNDNRASTLWYHDHTLGMTRLNVYAGPAGFYIVRGGPAGDRAVLDSRSGAEALLPGPAPKEGDAFPPLKTYYEIPIAIQDRSFNADGSLFYPDSRQFFDDLVGPHVGVHRLDEARRRTEELAALDRAKSEFFTTVSHELRTPLTLISGPAQDALAAETRPGQRRRLELVERHTRRLTGLVDALLDFGRMESGRMEPDPEPVDLPALTRGLAESFRPAVKRAGLAFVVRCEDLPAPVVVDREMYERIVLNLLSNALKYTPEGSIRLTLRGREDRVEVAVRDTGVGIAPDDLDRAFERFERLPVRPGARSREGAGIGLALVRQLTHLMGGTVTLTSRLGRGSVFTVGLPLDGPPGARSRGVPSVTPVRVADVLRDVDDWAAPSAAQEADDVERSASGRPRILVAEDNADLRRYLGDVLGEDYDIELVADGLAAVAAIRRRAPDLVVADVMMPGRDGYELVRDLRADPELAGIPVLLLSARAGASETSAGLAVGADDYLSKPFSVVELRARVASNLERAGARLRDASWRRAVLGPLHVALAITDLDGELLEVNDELAHLLGRPVPADAGADGRARWGPPDAAAPALTELRHRIARLARRGGGEEPEDVRLTHADGSPLWVRLRVGVVDGGRLGPSFAIATLRDVGAEHVARERRAAAARIAQEFTGAEDLTDVLATAVSGFGELFDGDVTVRVVVGGVERVFTASGPSDAAGFDDAAGPGRAPDDAATDRPVDRIVLGDGAGVGAGHRVCVMFPAARRVAADERVAGDLLYRAFVLACDRVVAASAFADREQHLRRAIASHEAIGQAVGILVERHRWTPAAAFERLKKVSQDSNTRLRDVADQVVESGADPGSTP